MLKFSVYKYLLFFFLVVFLFKSNQLKKIFSLGILFSIGFFSALIFATYCSLKANLEVVKFVIPLLTFLISFFYIMRAKSRKKFFQTFVMIMILLFGFFNGLGVFIDFIDIVPFDTSQLFPIILVSIGALISVLSLVFVFFFIRILLNKIKKISELNLSYAFSFIARLFYKQRQFCFVFELDSNVKATKRNNMNIRIKELMENFKILQMYLSAVVDIMYFVIKCQLS